MSKEVDDLEEDVKRIKEISMSSFLGLTYPHNENAVVFAFGRIYKGIESPLAETFLKERGSIELSSEQNTQTPNF